MANTLNKQMVSVQGEDTVMVMMPVQQMSNEEALTHAAWLVAMAIVNGRTEEEFLDTLKAVLNT